MQGSSRVDYDAIAELYDSQPHRGKSVDPELAAFLGGRAQPATLALLDIACGTGSQLIANRELAPGGRLVGIDAALGMLRRAQSKAPDIGWVRADAANLPLRGVSFDFISCQYAFHHLTDKAGMVREAFRVLRPGGRLTLYNLCPHDTPDWLHYVYFPEARTRDLADFWPPETIVATMVDAGFTDVTVDRQHLRYERDLAAILEIVRQRHTNSQLLSVSDAAYAAGIAQLERELDDPAAPHRRTDHLCLITIRGDKPV